jgi:hydroxymethylpyrimidine/phosphomethylpyrimidine kinase
MSIMRNKGSMAPQSPPKVVLTCAGSDPSGGAGVQMDLKCFAAIGVHGCSVICAITAQDTTGVRSVHSVPAAVVQGQMAAIFEDFKISAMKTGMLYDASIVKAVAAKVAREGTALIVDPVLSASLGVPLSKPNLVAAFRDLLIPRALLVTPNIPEAALIAQMDILGEGDMRRACREIRHLGCKSVLIKGGHLPSGPSNDIFYDGRFRSFKGQRLSRKVHGTGCMLSALITALIAKGHPLEKSIGMAKCHVAEVISSSSRIGRGMDIGDPFIGLKNTPIGSSQR